MPKRKRKYEEKLSFYGQDPDELIKKFLKAPAKKKKKARKKAKKE